MTVLSNVDIEENISIGVLKIQGMTKDTIREAGLDLTISDTYSREVDFTDSIPDIIDLHEQPKERFEKFTHKEIIINPKEFILLSTREIIELPNDIIGLCNIRSTIARSGIIAPPTITDPGFIGALTIEIFNASKRPILLHEGDRFLHLVLMYTKTACSKPYSGIYQNQKIVTPPKKSIL